MVSDLLSHPGNVRWSASGDRVHGVVEVSGDNWGMCYLLSGSRRKWWMKSQWRDGNPGEEKSEWGGRGEDEEVIFMGKEWETVQNTVVEVKEVGRPWALNVIYSRDFLECGVRDHRCSDWYGLPPPGSQVGVNAAAFGWEGTRFTNQTTPALWDLVFWTNPHLTLKHPSANLLRFIPIREERFQTSKDRLQVQGFLLYKLLLQKQGDH